MPSACNSKGPVRQWPVRLADAVEETPILSTASGTAAGTTQLGDSRLTIYTAIPPYTTNPTYTERRKGVNIIVSPTPPVIGRPISGVKAESGEAVETARVISLAPWQADSHGAETQLATTDTGRFLVVFQSRRPKEVTMHYPLSAATKEEAAVAAAAPVLPFGGAPRFAQSHYSITSTTCKRNEQNLGEIAGGK